MFSEPLIGEPLALDLVNTVAAAGDGETDLLASPGDLQAWLTAQRGRIDFPGREIPALCGNRARVARYYQRHKSVKSGR